jgi:transposase
MENTLKSLPNSVHELKKMVLKLEAQYTTVVNEWINKHEQLEAQYTTVVNEWINKHEQLESRYNQLLEQLKLARLKRFGQSTETSHQLALFDEADKPLPLETKETLLTEETVFPPKKRKNKGRRSLPANFPVEEVLHDISETDKQCACGHRRHRIGEEISEQLKYIPAQLIVVRHIRPKYACRACEEGITIAPMPLLLLPKSIATPELVAQTILSKYEDHVPLYRQEHIWKRLGVDLPRNSCCGWLMKVSEFCEPLWHLLKEDIVQSPYAQADETPVVVLKRGDTKKRKKAYMWCYRSHPPNGPSSICFEYQPSRSGAHAAEFLGDFKGFLQTDMYQGYRQFVKDNPPIIHVGCMAHARRYFADIVKVQQTPGLAHEAIQFFKALYTIEQDIKNCSIDVRYQIRQEKAESILKDFKAWLDKSVQQVPDQFAIGKAIHYCLNHWTELTHYTKHGLLHIDNNLIENNIRPFALGRRNWLFAGNPRGAKAGAIFYSLLATCKASHINPETYFVKMLSHIRACKTNEDFRQLLPYHIQL